MCCVAQGPTAHPMVCPPRPCLAPGAPQPVGPMGPRLWVPSLVPWAPRGLGIILEGQPTACMHLSLRAGPASWGGRGRAGKHISEFADSGRLPFSV